MLGPLPEASSQGAPPVPAAAQTQSYRYSGEGLQQPEAIPLTEMDQGSRLGGVLPSQEG